MNMKYKPRYGNINWVANQVLCWGSNTGWDITTDGKIACCRINYDDYVNFEIEVLTQEQIEEYKEYDNTSPKDIAKKFEVLEILFNSKLISKEDYNNKRRRLLDAL